MGSFRHRRRTVAVEDSGRMHTFDGIPTQTINAAWPPASSGPSGAAAPPSPVARHIMELFAGGPLPEWDSFARAIRLVRLRAGETLFDVGVQHPFIYVVRRGTIRVGFFDASGKECLLAFCQPPDVLASVSAIAPAGVKRLAELPAGIVKVRAVGHLGHTASRAVAVDYCELERLDFRIMEQLMKRHPAWAVAMFNAVTLHSLVKERRERELLILTPEQRYRRFLEDYPDLIGVVSQKDIASYLGVTPVGLSRIASRVRKDTAGG